MHQKKHEFPSHQKKKAEQRYTNKKINKALITVILQPNVPSKNGTFFFHTAGPACI